MVDRFSYKTLEIESNTQGIYQLWLNVPDKLNALSPQMQEDLICAMGELRKMNNLKVLIIGGRGRAFCAGGDVSNMKRPNFMVNQDFMKKHQEWFKALVDFDRPVVARLHGAVMGAGLSMAMACDYRVAESGARFGMAFIKLGLVPDLGCMFYLPRLVGLARAKELCMFGDPFDTNKAFSLGLVNEVVDPGYLDTRCLELAEKFNKVPYYAFNYIKSTLNKSFEISLEAVLEKESFYQPALKTTEEFNALVDSFMKK